MKSIKKEIEVKKEDEKKPADAKEEKKTDAKKEKSDEFANPALNPAAGAKELAEADSENVMIGKKEPSNLQTSTDLNLRSKVQIRA